MSDEKRIRVDTNKAGHPMLVVNFIGSDAGKLEMLVSDKEVMELIGSGTEVLAGEDDV